VLVEAGCVRLGLPLQPPGTALARLSRDALEQEPAEAEPDPGRLDPQVLKPPDLAARDQRRPADRPPLCLGNEEQALAQALGLEIATEGPLLDPGALVAPVRLRLNRDLA
jgi:hypothetical protein